jgi:hypothetical protein
MKLHNILMRRNTKNKNFLQHINNYGGSGIPFGFQVI